MQPLFILFSCSGYQENKVSGFWFPEKNFIQGGGSQCLPKLATGHNLYFHGSRVTFISNGNKPENKVSSFEMVFGHQLVAGRFLAYTASFRNWP
jgi:hypothetical protein